MIPIKGLEKASLIDYPGRMAAVVFLGGCNFRCGFCHNRELVLEHEKLESIPEEEILSFLVDRKDWLDGAVIGGGEPTIHKDLPEFLGKIKELGYPVKLDTNGSNPEMVKELLERGLVDYIAMDIKGPLERYAEICGTGANTQNIRESIRLIIESGIEHEFRSTMLPALHTREDVKEMAKLVKGANVFYLQQFRPKNTLDPGLEKERAFSEQEMKELKEMCGRHVRTELRLA